MSLQIGPTDDVDSCLALRHAVFVVEQGVSLEDEVDGHDGRAHHILARLNGVPVGCARILIKDDTGKIGRVCVLPSSRGTGLGSALIKACLTHLRKQKDVRRALLGSQTHAIAFYEKLGFVAFGPEYDDAGIPHRDMDLSL